MARKLKDAFKEIALSRAYIATHVYKKYADVALPEGWERVCHSNDLMGANANGFEGALYRHRHPVTHEDRYILAFCGFDDAGDIPNVIAAGFLGIPDQLEDAYAFTAKACAQYKIPSSKLEFAGHSLGGYLAKAVADHWGARAVWSFNSPGFVEDAPELLKTFFTERPFCAERRPVSLKNRIHCINSKYDVVSRWGFQTGNVYEIETPGDHHNMRVLIESLTSVCLVSKRPETAGKLRLAARKVFDNIGKSDLFRNSLDNIFRKKKRKTPPENKP